MEQMIIALFFALSIAAGSGEVTAVECETGQMPGADRANLAYSCDWLAGDVVLFTTAGGVFPSAEIAALAGQFGAGRIEVY